ncbi:MAG: VOC family protein [Alphaproteobacteria bacterium]
MSQVIIVYNTDRFDETLDWWRQGLGLECVKLWDRDDSRGAVLTLGPGAQVEIFSAARGAPPLAPPPIDTFQIKIPSDDPRAEMARLKARGLSIEQPLTERPWATQFTLRDPNSVEVYIYRSKD